MARIRSLKPEHKSHRKVGQLSDFEYRLWVGMITEADDEGRLVAAPLQLRAEIFPYRPRPLPSIQAALERLALQGLIELYRVEQTQYARFPDWSEHQRIHKNHFSASKLPLPHPTSEVVPDLSRTGPGPVPQGGGIGPVGSERSGMDRIGREGSVRGGGAGPARLVGAPEPPGASDQGPMQEPPAGPLAPELAAFMATVRAAARQPLGFVPRRGDDEAV